MSKERLQEFTEDELRNILEATERIAPGSEGSRAIRRELERREAGGRPCSLCPHLSGASPSLLTLKEAALVLRMDQTRLRRAARRGRIPGALIMPTGETRFDRDRLFAWIREGVPSQSVAKKLRPTTQVIGL